MSLQSHLRHVGTAPTTLEQIEITKRRSRLLNRITDHQRRAHQYLQTVLPEDDDYSFEPSEVYMVGLDGELDLVTNALASNPFLSREAGPRPECFRISLPSGMSKTVRGVHGLDHAAELEVQLQVGQCNDALKAIRLALGQKAFLFRTQIRPKGPKTGKTKSWDGIHAVDQTLRLHAQIYRSAREALIDLQASKLITDRFKPLETAQLKTSTTLLNPSESGWKHGQLPWFWYLDVAGDSISATHLRECKSLASHDLMPF